MLTISGCDCIGPTQTSPEFYWLQLHWGKYDILTEFRVCCSSVRMKQLQFLFSNNRGPEVFSGIMTLIIICHQNDNDHHHHWDETLWTVPVASESIRFYMSTYTAHYTLLIMIQGSIWILLVNTAKCNSNGINDSQNINWLIVDIWGRKWECSTCVCLQDPWWL